MKITAKSPNNTSLSFSRRYFHCKLKVDDQLVNDDEEILTFTSTSHAFDDEELRVIHELDLASPAPPPPAKPSKKKITFRSALAIFGKGRAHHHAGLGTRVVGTLFGHRRGHVLVAFQEDPKQSPAFLVELAMPTSVLVREMASGLVRIALECEKTAAKKKAAKLLEEPIWRTYCNGRKCGYSVRRDCGPGEWKVLSAVGPVSMGAGVLPESVGGNGGRGGSDDGELMYMRARFERVVGSKDSEAFYMMNPEGHGGPELSLYLIRV
ncbi:hypothetical protein NMG60_11036082 [Bertholletia excelsa]